MFNDNDGKLLFLDYINFKLSTIISEIAFLLVGGS